MYPGDTVHWTLQNNIADGASTTPSHNNPGTPDNTNLHTHGLHVDTCEDNPWTEVLPGCQQTYTYHIPANHHPGMHWYHAHYHGTPQPDPPRYSKRRALVPVTTASPPLPQPLPTSSPPLGSCCC